MPQELNTDHSPTGVLADGVLGDMHPMVRSRDSFAWPSLEAPDATDHPDNSIAASGDVVMNGGVITTAGEVQKGSEQHLRRLGGHVRGLH